MNLGGKAFSMALTAATGVGGYLLGSCQKNDGIFQSAFSDAFFQVNADVKDVQPSAPISLVPALSSVDSRKIIQPVGSPNTSVGPHRAVEIMRHGFPTVDSLRYRSDYVLAYDRYCNWVSA